MENINYKVVITDISTSTVYIKTITFPYNDVDEVDARDIAEQNNLIVEDYIDRIMGLNLAFVNYVILADDDDVFVYTD